MGPTGAGKSAVAEWLADEFSAQLVNADAFQVYRGLDIGTNKPSDKHRYELLDLVEPTEEFGVLQWVKAALPILESASARSRNVILVGGTGYYLRALMEEYTDLRPAPEPELRAHLAQRLAQEGLARLAAELQAKAPEIAARIDLRNPVRVARALERLESGPPFRFSLPAFRRLKVAVDPPVARLDERITDRVDEMLQAGWCEEVESLRSQGIPSDAPGLRAIGYRALYAYLGGSITRESARDEIVLATRQYARRQRTWLRSEPRLSVVSCADTWPDQEPRTTGTAIAAMLRARE
jgi:tRNA dimethylallyltransferase